MNSLIRMLRHCSPLLIIVLTILYFPTFAQLPAGFVDIRVQSNYTAPMGVIFSKNGQRMFIWEKSGILYVSNWNDTTYVRQPAPVLDISEEIGDWRDFGLQSIALDPKFDENGLIYLYYQVDRHHLLNFGTPQYNSTTNEYFNATISRLTRYKLTATGNILTVDNNSRTVLIGATKNTGVPLLHESHGGGQIVFGTDSTLLVTTGDNASFYGIDAGSAPETYYQQALADGIIKSAENVGAFRSQMINSFCGKVLRLNPQSGNGYASNPYYDSTNPRSAKSLVWALGFRNPYRMALKTGTGSTNPNDGNPGTLLISDVQYGYWEELDIVEKGGVNCGWPLYEGLELLGGFWDVETRDQEEPNSPLFKDQLSQPTSSVIASTPSQRRYTHFPPAIDYSHESNITRYPSYSGGTLTKTLMGSPNSHIEGEPFNGNCVTAGTYYNGSAFHPNYQNVFFFADYGTNWIKAAVIHDNSDHPIHEIKEFAPEGYCNGVVDIEYCPLDQSIFYVNINNGTIHKVSFGSSNRPPVATISADKLIGNSPLTVNFSSTGSSDPDGNSLTYQWNFGDGSAISTLPNPTHTFTATGAQGFTVTLTVRDNLGLTDIKTVLISLNNTPPTVKITQPTNAYTYTLAQATNLTLQANVTDSSPSGMSYAWQATLRHNNHEHREPVMTQPSPTVVVSPVGCTGDTYYYLIELTVTDNGGLTAKDSVKIYPNCSTGSLAIKNLSTTPLINAMRLNWSNPLISFDEIMVVAKLDTNFITEPIGASYIADSSIVGVGTDFDGGKVVYKGTGTSVIIANMKAGRRYYFRVFTRKGSFWNSGVETSDIPLTGPACIGDGKLFIETWLNIGNSTCVDDIPVNMPPTNTNTLTLNGFEITERELDNFGSILRGYICAPESGQYTFYIASDNGGELFLSTNDNPETKRSIAALPDCSYTDFREWTKFEAQKSESITLIAGQKYYIEAHYKDGDGGDHLSIGWQLPTEPSDPIQVIPAISITPYVPPSVQSCNGDGKLLIEKWLDIGSSTCVSDIPILAAPTTISTISLNGFEAPRNSGDNYGMRMRGYICAPETGEYTFYLSSDNDGVLYLSTDTMPANKQLIADIPNCGFTSYRQWTKFPTQKSAKISLVAGQKYYIEALFKESNGGDHLSVGWQIPSNPIGVIKVIPPTSISAFMPPPPSLCSGDSKLYVETWNNLSGNTCIGSIPLSIAPTTAATLTLNGFEAPINSGDNYGMRLRGYLCAPETGEYTFYIASDNAGSLWLSTNSQASTKRQIAFVPNCDYTNFRQWTKFPQQKSVKISLIAGQKYFIEALFKEADGGDHLSVGWQLPSNPNGAITVIPANTLTAYIPQITTGFDPAKCYKITSRFTNKVIEVPNASLVEGIGIQQNRDTIGLKHKLWKIQTNGDDSYRLLNANSGYVADVEEGLLFPATPLVQWSWNTDDNQRWIFTANTEGYYTIKAKHSQLVLDILKNSTLDGAPLIQNTPSTSLSQQWSVTENTCPLGTASLMGKTFISVRGYWEGQKVVISWLSNARHHEDYFVIEKINATQPQFEKADIQKARIVKSATIDYQSYSFTDNHPNEGENLYRVVLYRYGAPKPVYSEIITLKAPQFSDYWLFPNPAQDYIDIDLKKVEKKPVDISIWDASGHILKHQKIESATSTPFRLQLDNIANGTYLIQIATKGKRVSMKTIVIQR